MQILMTNHKLSELGGSETWTKTMYDELSQRHNVDVFTPRRNTLYPEMPRFDPKKTYDLVLQNHSNTFTKRLPQFKKHIFTSHGIIPKIERPIPGADHYVAVSEEVRDFDRPNYEATVIRNPINTKLFTPTRPLPDRPRRVLFISNNRGRALGTVEEACRGLILQTLGGPRRRDNVQEMMNWADIVISLGRGCYEALSCGRNVIVYDIHGGDGFVTPETILDFRYNNCSGRYSKTQFTPAMLRAEINKYDPALSDDLRQYAVETHSAEKIVDQYLELA